MKIFKRILNNKDKLAIIIVIAFAILAARSLIFESGYFLMHDDLQMMRQLEMEKCFLDGQIPCRWVPDMGYGFGYPLFNYYPPLPYLIGEVFRVIGFSFVTTVKLTFALSFILSGIFMYLLAKDFFGRVGGELASIFYVWAPYHAVDVYVRGAMNEAWALVWFPAIFWGTYRLIKTKKDIGKWIVFIALSWFGLLTSHNLMVLIIAPFFAGWVLLWLIKDKEWRKIPHLVLSGLWALGLSAFFTLPVLIEGGFTRVSEITVGYYNYTVHFVSLNQLLITRFWGYGPSVWLEDDGMPFQVGHIHWVLSIILVGFVLFRFIKRKKLDKLDLSVIAMFGIGWFATFMAHLRSIYIWTLIKPIEFVQFPWRFLALSIFAFSFIIGAVPWLLRNIDGSKKTKKLNQKIIVICMILIFALVGFNWNYFKPEYGHMGPLTDKEKFSDVAWDKQQTAGIYDYLPKTAKEAPKEARGELVDVIEGEAKVLDQIEGTNWAKFGLEVASDEVEIRINTIYFPGWEIKVNDVVTKSYIPEEEVWGRMYVKIPKGTNRIEANFIDTRIRTVANLVSLASWILLLGYLLNRRWHFIKRN